MHTIKMATVLCAAAGTLAACGSSGSSASSGTSSAPAGTSAPATAGQAAANPVTILKQTGVTPDPGTVYGDHDAFGDRMTSGSFPGGESVTVYTSYTQADFQAEQARPPVDDSHGVVVIPGKLAVIVVDAGGQPSGWGGPTPAQIASRVHGTALPPH